MNTVRRHVQIAGQAVDANTQRLHELLVQDLAGMDWIDQFGFPGHGVSMIIHYFNVVHLAIVPHETDPPTDR
jgi:hypothetical protein